MEVFPKSIYYTGLWPVNEAKQNQHTEYELQTNPDGSLYLPAEVVKQLGIAPAGKVLVTSSPDHLSFRSLDPKLTKLYVEPTNACNLSCSTCIRHTWNDPVGMMNMATYEKLLSSVRGISSLEKISFWGFGEPLLHPDIVLMVRQAKQLGVRTQLITNGLLMDLKMAAGFVDAGLDSIVFSVDGTNSDINADIRSGADLNRIKKNVNLLRIVRANSQRKNPEIGIEFVAMRKNIKELGNLRNLAASMGASFIIVTNVLPYSSELKDEILYWNSAGYIKSDLGYEWSPKLHLPPMDNVHGVAEHVSKLMPHNEPVEFLQRSDSNSKGYCRFVGEGSLVVNWEGDVSPCVALMHSYSCYVLGRKKEIKRYSIGNINQDEMRDLWNKEDFAQFRERVQRFDFSPCTHCSGCDFTETNEEDCFGNTFPVCGDCLWAQGIIQCP